MLENFADFAEFGRVCEINFCELNFMITCAHTSYVLVKERNCCEYISGVIFSLKYNYHYVL